MKLPMIVTVRGYAIPANSQRKPQKKPAPNRDRKTLRNPARERLIFDCETTADHLQNLRFGTFQCRKDGKLTEHGIFYEANNHTVLSARDIAVIRSYTRKHGLTLYTREEFVEKIFYRYVFAYEALIVGFNLPFDLSRLAIGIATSHARDMRNAFSLKLSSNSFRSNVLVRHLNSRAAFIRLAAATQRDGRPDRKHGIKTRPRRGFFLDVKTLAAALVGKHTLKSLADALETPHRKLDAGGHGRAITPKYLDYAMNDTQVTWECYERLQSDYDKHGLTQTPSYRIYSEASLGKAYLNQMGIVPLRKSQPDTSPEIIGRIMGSFYGGRSEVRIRRQITRILYCDFRSMYPTVCTLMGLWRFVIARGFEWKDWTNEARQLLETVELSDLRKRDFWESLSVLVQIEPNDDVLPVRAAYSGQSRTIGLNHLSAKFPIWFTLADCVASKLFTARAPRVVSAVQFEAHSPQPELKPIRLGGDANFLIQPASGDFYRDLIVKRGQIQKNQKQAKKDGNESEAERLADYQMMLKLIANSTSYGIFAEQNAQSHERPREVELFGQERKSRTTSKNIEEPGTHFHPLIATLITGAARLMLACAERVAADQGIGWAFCDTDSLALARPDGMADAEFVQRCESVIGWFDGLDPYGDGVSLFKVESQNFSLANGEVTDRYGELYALAISAKRYVLFNLDAAGLPVIRKALAHGLGHLMEPYGEKDAPATIPPPSQDLAALEVKRWQYDLWYRIILATLEGHPDRVDLTGLPHLNRPARSRYGANTAALRNWFRRFNEGKPIQQQVKCFNFLLAYQTSRPAYANAIAKCEFEDWLLEDGLPAVVAPFCDDPKKAVANCFDRRTGKPVPASILKTYREAIADYHLHSESKFENGEGSDVGLTRRRHVEAVALEYIGKEANRLEEQIYLGEMPEAHIEYGTDKPGQRRIQTVIGEAAQRFGQIALAQAARISRKELADISNATVRPRLATVRRVVAAIAELTIQSLDQAVAQDALVQTLKDEIARSSASDVAAYYEIDPSNLAKIVGGTRRVPVALAKRMDANAIRLGRKR